MTESERVLPLFPLEQVVLFPGMSLPLRIFEERYKVMIGACHVTDQLFGVLLIRSGSEVGAPAVPERIGCTARMLRVDRLPDGRMNILTIGEQRFRLLGQARTMAEGYLVGDARLLTDDATAPVPSHLVERVTAEFAKYEQARLAGRQHMPLRPELARDPVRLSYQVAAGPPLPPARRPELLQPGQVGGRAEHGAGPRHRAN